ncbi:MAG: TraB family protein [Candidatus Nanohaloarchaea archaeon]
MRKKVSVGDREITIVGTAHISQESRREVRETIESEEPDLVGVELDENRYDSLREESGWRDLDAVDAIRQGQGYLLFLNLLLSIFQRRLGLEEGMKPGAELMEAISAAEDSGVEFALLDRDINKTFRRVMDQLTWTEKFRLLSSLMVVGEEVEVQELKQESILNTFIRKLEDDFPTIKRVFLDERNDFMAEKLLEKDFDSAVVVVGAAHVEGIAESLRSGPEYVPRESDSFPWLKAFKYGLPLFVLGSLSYGFMTTDFSTAVQATVFFVLINSFLSMLGAVLAGTHPVTWLVSFLAAPITSIDPALGAGMVAAYTEGKIRPPSVQELEEVAHLASYRALWTNQVGRILLAFVFVTLGSALGTFIGAGYIAAVLPPL